MAFRVLVEELVSSDEETLDVNFAVIPKLPILPPLNDADEDDELRVLNSIAETLQKRQQALVDHPINFIHNYDNIDFIINFRLSRKTTYDLISRFRISEIFSTIESRGESLKISAEKHILTYLWFIGHHCSSYRDVSDRFSITVSSMHSVLTRVTDFLLTLAPDIIRYPTQSEKEATSNYFYEQKRLRGIIGAIDGTQIRIDRPAEDPDLYINRNQYYSLHIQGTVDHNLKFLDVFIGYPGSVDDATVFLKSTLYQDLSNICGDHFFFIADNKYPCLKQVMVPYKDNRNLTRTQKLFNQKLNSSRIIIEDTFGCLKQRFRLLYHLKFREMIRMVRIIHACCVLHNLANPEELQLFEDSVDNQHQYPDINLKDHQYVRPGYAEVNDEKVNAIGIQTRNQICSRIYRQGANN